MMLPIALAALLGWLLIRLSVCLPSFRQKRAKRVLAGQRLTTMVVWGSGGHTTEMIMLLKNLSASEFGPVHNVLASSDTTSLDKITASQVDVLEYSLWHHVMRSREVKQSWLTTVFTTLYSCLQSLHLVFVLQPQLLIVNGPGTCVPICYAAFAMNLLGKTDCSIVFVESFCRVDHLSVTGKLLYPIVDRFIVQWEGLAEGLPRAEFLGDLAPRVG